MKTKLFFISLLIFSLNGMGQQNDSISKKIIYNDNLEYYLDTVSKEVYPILNQPYAPPKKLYDSRSTVLNITHYRQCNQSWSSTPLGGCTGDICDLGCAMTCAAMILKANGVNVNPGQLNTWLTNNCGYQDNNGIGCYGCNIRWYVVPNYPGTSVTWYNTASYQLSTIKSEIDGGNPVIVQVNSASGIVCGHFVVVYGYNNSGTNSGDFLVADPGSSTFPKYLSSFTICPTSPQLRIFHNVNAGSVAAPANDNCSNATTLTSTTSCVNTPGDVAGATSSGLTIPSCSGYASSYALDVWYKFNAQASSSIVKVTPSSGMDAVVAVYNGCSSSGFLDCIDNGGGSGGIETLNLTGLTVGNTYYIRVYEYGNPGTTTTFNICVTHTGGGVDPCTSVTTISGCGSSNAKTYTGGGTGSWFNSTSNPCGFTTPGIEKIYSFVPSTTGTYSIQVTAASGFVDYLWKSGSCSSSGWNCIDDINSTGTYNVGTTWNAGTTYYLLLDDEDNTTGTHTFYINCPGCPQPSNDGCSGSFAAISLSFGSSCTPFPSTSCGATSSGFSTCVNPAGQDDDVFFSFVPTSNSATITVVSSAGYDAVFQVLNGPCGSSMSQLACVDETGTGGTETTIVSGLTTGTTYFIRVWHYGSGYGTTGNFTICVYGCTVPAQPGTISGNTTVCQGSSNTYSISSVSGATGYTWTLPSGWTGSSSTTSITTTAGSSGGTISVTADNSCGSSTPRTISVSVATVTGQPGTISGNTAICQGSSNTYSISAVSGANNYTWSLPSGWTGSSSTTSITTIAGSSGGTISVTANNSCGSSTPRTLSISVTPVPGQPGTISGNTTVCQSSSNTYSISAVSGANNYTWTLPSGWTGSSSTTSITTIAGSSGGTISVSANNNCGSGTSRTLSVSVPSIPTQPGTISGNTTVCQGSSNTYSISSVSGATGYTWTLPSGWTGSSSTTSITTTAGSSGGMISVTANNNCGSSTPRTISVSVATVTGQPGTISGNTVICQGSSNTYSISEVSGANNYTWSLPSGWTGSSSTTSITTIAGSSGGTISVTANNSCGSSTPRTLSISVTPVPGQPGTISGNTTVCQGSSNTYSISAVSGANNYTWTLPSGWTGSSTTTSITTIAGSSGGTISVSANNNCGSGTSRTLSVSVPSIPTQPGTISGNTTVCQVSSTTYSISAVPGATSYMWAYSGTGATINGNTNSITINFTSTATPGNLTVKGENECGYGPVSPNFPIAVNAAPVANAGADATISQTGTCTLAGTATNHSSVLWTTSGNGTFSSASSLTPVYTPGTNDIATGSVQLCMAANGMAGCANASDCMTLTISLTTSDQITLYPGWNLISFDVTPSPATPVSVFAPLIANNNLLMVTGYEQGGLLYDPNGLPFLNTLTEIKNGFGYWVKVTNTAMLSVTGANISPTFEINLKTGWNLVAYWPSENITPEVAFAPLISLGVLQTVTGYEQGGKFYDPSGPAFLNTLTEIKNGFGYWVKVSADFNGFTYPLSWACGDNFTDSRDDKVYTTVQIGTQCWMKQNLNIGTRIDGANNQTNNETIEKYCYDNLEANCDVYGGLYQWDEMMQNSITVGAQGICPSGWHLPTDAEWTALTTYVSNQPAYLCNSNSSYFAKALAATTNWNTSTQTCAVGNNLAYNNATGFTCLPGGYRSTNGSFNGIIYNDYSWSSSEYSIANAYFRNLNYSSASVTNGGYNKGNGLSVRCLKDENTQVSDPTVTTSELSSITSTSAISGGDITSDGGAPATARGVCWSTSQNPTIANSLTTNGTGPGAFTSNLSDLTAGTTYFVRAYATNSVGTAYGNQQSFTTLVIQCPGSITDTRDGKVYNTVLIGNQCWMKQNLNFGFLINNNSNQINNGISEKYCFNNLETNCDVYGGLYQWDEMMEYNITEGVQGICPYGWHLPTDSEWTALTTYVSNQPAFLCNSNTNYIAKALASETYWLTYTGTCVIGNNLSSNNATGFTALPGGHRIGLNVFGNFEGYGYWWSSTPYDALYAWYRNLSYGQANVYRGNSSYDKSYGHSVRCLKDESSQVSLPSVTTNDISTVTSTTANSGGEVTSDGGAAVIARGVCWSTTPYPTIADNLTLNGNGIGAFTSNITGLTPGTTYYVRAYATNSVGTAYGNQQSFTTLAMQCPSSITDTRDGKVYTTVQIGTQCWMKQNLNIGTRIDGVNEQTNNGTIEKYCYNNLETNCDNYGGLYQWNEMMGYTTTAGVQGICPEGWHLPTDAEWTQLVDYVVAQGYPNEWNNQNGAGNALKSCRQVNSPLGGDCNTSVHPRWIEYSFYGFDTFGFAALPGGYRNPNGPFYDIGNYGNFWSSTEFSATYAWYRYLNYYGANVYRLDDYKGYGFSVRCLRD